jgi:GrpB-like predicted nucleotidyltransferase (UPF0157 family)
MDESYRARIETLARERVDIVPYDPAWPAEYAREEAFLRAQLPADLVLRIAHIGSTAVPGSSAKPIIDVQVEVKDLQRVRSEVVPVLTTHGYECIWRPSIGERAPFYAWFIKRGQQGARSHHLHMVEPDDASSDRIRFRDLLRADKEELRRYETLKQALARQHPNDRAAYTRGKAAYIAELLGKGSGLTAE